MLTSGVDIGSPIAAALAARGARVACLGDAYDASPIDGDERVTRIAASFASRAALEQAFAAAVEAVGVTGPVVVSAMPLAALAAVDIVALSDEQWRAACSAAMKSVLYALQASHTRPVGARRFGGRDRPVAVACRGGAAGAVVDRDRRPARARQVDRAPVGPARHHGQLDRRRAARPVAAFDALPLPVKPDPVRVALGRPLDLATRDRAGDRVPRQCRRACDDRRHAVLDGGEWMVP